MRDRSWQDSYILSARNRYSMNMSPFPTPVGTSDEHRQVTGGTVDSIHREVKQRFFLQIPEVLRIRIEVRYLVGLVRGEQYVRLQSMRGEDFAFVLVRTCLSLYSIRVMAIFEHSHVLLEGQIFD